MNERLNLQDLIDFLAKKQDLTKKDAESFLRELVAVISETIESNESVRIKDFGLFKLVKVNARKSVDVNTGEAIEIAAHYKLSFTPDKAFKEAINKPFAHFESVILEEGVSFDNIEADNQVDTEDENDPDTGIENDVIEVEETKEEPSVVVEELTSTDAETSEQQSIEEIIPAASSEMGESDQSEVGDGSAISKEEPEDIESMFQSHERKTKRRRFISLSFIVCLIIAGFAIGGYYFQELAMGLTSDPSIQKEEIVVVNAPDTVPLTDTLPLKVIEKDSIVDVVKAPITETKNVSNDNAPLAKITIESGHTLRNISLKYYGHKSFWIYIYQENKGAIKNPNNVPIGTKLTIPAPSKYGIDAKDPAAVKKAKAAESKLISSLSL